MFDSIFHLLSDSPQAYFILLGVCAGDAVLPALPSESAVILAGILSVVGDLSLEWVLAVAALGAFIGDNMSYAIGRFVGQPVRRRFFDGERGRSAVEWARGQLKRRGGTLVLVARFIPGGRTATTFTCGLTHFSWPRFAAFAALAAVLWALYGGLLGYFGGRMFHDRPWLALLVAFGIAFGLTIGIESVRRVRERA
ncbi:MAG TPA: DedA family protein [Gaiellaceae bacterium]|jgi:membrane protein DedA with SNARE-associated domain